MGTGFSNLDFMPTHLGVNLIHRLEIVSHIGEENSGLHDVL